MTITETVESERVTGDVIIAGTIRIAVSASVWSHGGHWGGTVTFAGHLGIEPGDRARLRLPAARDFPISVASVTRHEGGESTLTFDGFGPPPGFGESSRATLEATVTRR